ANPNGKVFVAMYHHLGDRKNPFYRSVEQFNNDLDRMDKMGFRPVTVSAYLSGKMDLAPGASPVVMTFDDANADQVRFLDDGTLDPTCMIGLWAAFAKSHPDFPVHATFFILPDSLFGQPKWRDAKLALLKSLGCELANHTITHPILRKMTDEQVEQEIGDASERLEKLGQALPTALALPFGSSPRNKALLRGFDWHGKHVDLTGVFLVGSNPAPPTTDAKFNRFAIPRIQANEGEYGLTYWLNRVAAGRVKVYVQP
ncbi:MAG: polysaccharide deacetylase family protein, partial [Fimbriimonadaceae bacterium]